MKIPTLLAVVSFMIICLTANAQVLDEETGFIYVKAEYLYETGRFEEAITQYNHVITKDPKYKEALLHRGHAKFALAAYKGAKIDAMQAIDLKGITAESAALLGRATYAMGERNSGFNNMSAAIELDKKNQSYYEWRAEMYEQTDQKLKACQDYEAAMYLGSVMAETKAKNLCGITKTRQQPSTQQPASQQGEVIKRTEPANTQPVDNNRLEENEVLSDGTREENTQPTQQTQTTPAPVDTTVVKKDDSEPPVFDENLPKNDGTVNTFEIDEELSISISGQELGKRKIKETPSILILADENGKVTIDICVNKEGTVTKAEFNGSMSTIAKKSLVSLAIRKAREFEFDTGKYDLQCGIMVFNIKTN